MAGQRSVTIIVDPSRLTAASGTGTLVTAPADMSLVEANFDPSGGKLRVVLTFTSAAWVDVPSDPGAPPPSLGDPGDIRR